MVGIEAAIVLIAFVIVAAAFSFMVVNMGLFSTQRGRETIQDSILEVNSPLIADGSLHVRATSETKADAVVIPLKTIGIRDVSIAQIPTVISLRVENHTAIANIYDGINTTNPSGYTFDDLVLGIGTSTSAKFFIGNSDGDSSLDYDEKGLLVIYLASINQASAREHIFVEIRLEKGAPLTIEFIVPSELTQGWLAIGG